MPELQQIDIRQGEYFAFMGSEIKKAIDTRIQSVLKPAYEGAMDSISELLGESPSSESMAGLVAALAGHPEAWNAKTSEIHRNAQIANEHNLEIQDIGRMAPAFADNVKYLINPAQLKRFGLGS